MADSMSYISAATSLHSPIYNVRLPVCMYEEVCTRILSCALPIVKTINHLSKGLNFCLSIYINSIHEGLVISSRTIHFSKFDCYREIKYYCRHFSLIIDRQ